MAFHKIILSIFLLSSLKNQVINSKIDPDTMNHFSQCQNIPPITVHVPIVNPFISLELINEKIDHL